MMRLLNQSYISQIRLRAQVKVEKKTLTWQILTSKRILKVLKF